MAAENQLTALQDWLGPQLAKLTPAERRGLARKVGQDVRRSQARRIASQQNPDSSPYVPRKANRTRQQKGRIRRSMFAKMRTTEHLRVHSDEAEASIGFVGRTARIARVHQEGLRDRVVPSGPVHTYPVRKLLGFSEADHERIVDLILQHFA